MTNHDRFDPFTYHDVEIPRHLVYRTTRDNLTKDFNAFGFDGKQFFGSAFIQGNRLQFTTSMPIRTMLEISKADQAQRGSTVAEVTRHGNRPKVPSHAKEIRKYFELTACAGEKFILPAFAFNYGDEDTMGEDAIDARLVIFAHANEKGTNGWPALFELPRQTKVDTTDGAHRRGEIEALLSDNSKLPDDQKENLARNAVDVKFVFESRRVDTHQDFADCAKARAITKSLISTWDVREVRNKRAVALVNSVPFLGSYVDATAHNVNLSMGSTKIWSQTAISGFVSHIQGHSPPRRDLANELQENEVEAELGEQLKGVEDFFIKLIAHIPELRQLERARHDPKLEISTGDLRKKRGGNIVLRAVGLAILARAFIYAKEHGLSNEDVAKKLAEIDWHLLDCERDELPDPSTDEGRANFANAVYAHVVPMWQSLLHVSENRYRIAAGNAEANQAWDRIITKHFAPVPAQEAAE